MAIDLFCGLGGWAEGFLDEGYEIIGFDIERHDYGTGGYPGQLVLQDVLTLHGSQFKDAAVIVASPPCQEFSYMAMPWTRAKQIARALRGEDEFPEGYTGSRTVEQLNALFNACFRIQREACESAGRYIPLVVENVRGACPWVGEPSWAFGSYYLWGDVPALMVVPSLLRTKRPEGAKTPSGNCSSAMWKDRDIARYAHPTPQEYEKHGFADGRKVPGFRFDGSGRLFPESESVKVCSTDGGRRTDPGKGARFTSRDCGAEGLKFGGGWRHDSTNNPIRKASSRSSARKAASARIAKIPFALAQHIARVYKPTFSEAVA